MAEPPMFIRCNDQSRPLPGIFRFISKPSPFQSLYRNLSNRVIAHNRNQAQTQYNILQFSIKLHCLHCFLSPSTSTSFSFFQSTLIKCLCHCFLLNLFFRFVEVNHSFIGSVFHVFALSMPLHTCLHCYSTFT